MAQWDTAYVNNLPDSAFAWIDPRYKSGESDDKSMRKLPYKDADGNADLPHVRNALARLDQTDGPSAEEKAQIRKKLEGLLEREKMTKRVSKIVMIAPDTYYHQIDMGDGTVKQIAKKREPPELLRIFEGTVTRLQQTDGAQFPVPIIEEHEYQGRPLGAVETVALVEMGDGKIGLEASMLLEDEEVARRLTEGTLWTSPGVIYDGLLGVDDQMGDYMEELSIVAAPAQRDYRARELFSAREYKLAPERANIEREVKKMTETTVTATVEQLSRDIQAITVEKEMLKKELTATKGELAKLKVDFATANDKLQEVGLETLKKDLAEKGFVVGEIEKIIDRVKAHPEDQVDIVALAEKMGARLTKIEGAPTSSTVPGKAPETAKEAETRIEHIVEDFVKEQKGVKNE